MPLSKGAHTSWFRARRLMIDHAAKGPAEFAEVIELRDQLDRSLRSSVYRMQRRGTSWTEIGAALGISRQAAYQRYEKPLP